MQASSLGWLISWAAEEVVLWGRAGLSVFTVNLQPCGRAPSFFFLHLIGEIYIFLSLMSVAVQM